MADGPNGAPPQDTAAPGPARPEAVWSYTRLFAVWFLVGLLAGLAASLPRMRSARAEALTAPGHRTTAGPVGSR